MMTKDEALKMAIEALKQYVGVVQHKVNAETWGDIEDGGKPAIKAIQACKEALDTEQVREDDAQPAQGEIVVTKNDTGQIVMVSRQDSEGNILSVIAESENT